MTPLFLVLAVATFLTPAALLSSPDAFGATGPLVQAGLGATLATVSAALLFVVLPRLLRAFRRSGAILVVAATAVAAANALRLASGWRLGGGPADVLLAVWFAAPLALWAVAIAPDLGHGSSWWTGPMGWVAVAFPLAFLVAGLEPGGPVAPALGWVLAYAPTVALAGVAVMGWLSFEGRSRPSAREAAVRVAAPAALAVGLGLAIAAAGSVGFILSATITWGSGYQLFTTPPPPPPLGIAFVLVTLAAVAFAVTYVRVRTRAGRSVLLLLLAAVLCGILPSPVSVLGPLAALQLVWLRLTRAGAPPAAAPTAPAPPASSAGG